MELTSDFSEMSPNPTDPYAAAATKFEEWVKEYEEEEGVSIDEREPDKYQRPGKMYDDDGNWVDDDGNLINPGMLDWYN